MLQLESEAQSHESKRAALTAKGIYHPIAAAISLTAFGGLYLAGYDKEAITAASASAALVVAYRAIKWVARNFTFDTEEKT
jgi:hypothetical protein